mmetsp:Transcript_67022/g.216066  ORF Transcript_67022/g.216066 Transcript_67022/m.216066 type:complete len:239 (+) Transcript_67022:128-844(+)
MAEDEARDGFLEGEVSAWYPGQGLIGRDYGYICRSIPPPPAQPGTLVFAQVQHYRFEKSSVAQECLAALAMENWRGLIVNFRFAGRDACGRWRAVDVCLPPVGRAIARGAGRQQAAAGEPAATAPLQAAGAAAQGGVGVAAGAVPAEVVQGLIRKALRKLGGQGTRGEVVEKIKSTPKMFLKVQAHLKAGARSSGSEPVWEELVRKGMKAACTYTGEKRPGASGSDAKVYSLREEQAA